MTKKTSVATMAIATYQPLPSPGFVDGKTLAASVHAISAVVSSTVQWTPISTPSTRPRRTVSRT